MRTAVKGGLAALALIATPVLAQAGPLEGAAIGAGAGAVIAGPPGAVAGGVIGGVVGGPNVIPRRSYAPRRAYARAQKVCWNDRYGHRHCRWR